jgi:CO dehydrogenase nickel-insertion accessory protein CooC1
VDYKSIEMILNRVRDESEVQNIRSNVSIDVLGWLPEDKLIREFDFYGRSFLDFPTASTTCKIVDNIIHIIEL